MSSSHPVHATAALARLALSPEQEQRLGAQFERILSAFEALSELELEGVPEMGAPGGERSVLRPDEPRASLEREALLALAPEREAEFYKVPKTVGGES